MVYKKYTAHTFQEAKLKMLLDVGHNAYIVSQKRIKTGGFLGFFGKPMVELTVGVLNKASQKENPNNTAKNKLETNLGANSDNANSSSEIITREFKELKSLLTKVLTTNTVNMPDDRNLSNSYESSNGNLSNLNINSSNSLSNKTKDLAKLLLKEEEFDDQFINAICSLSSVELFLSRENNLAQIKNYLKSQINEVIETSSGISINDNASNIIVLVGPTGVGKTTTLAKLGAYFGVFKKKRVKFISIDTYRVGAIQQLKLYADIMNIPFSKVNNIEEFRMGLHKIDYDIVLVDTTGRSQKNTEEIRDIKKYLDTIEQKFSVSLVLSATTKYTDLVETLDKFDMLNYDNIILTKLDETNRIGQVISAISPKKRGLSYVTFGQSVPEDIEVASKNKLFDMVLEK